MVTVSKYSYRSQIIQSSQILEDGSKKSRQIFPKAGRNEGPA